MNDNLRLLFVLAHPDDEALGNGGTIAKYAAEGVDTYLVTATRGQKGWFFNPDENPGPEELGRIRERELRAAAGVLGLKEVSFLDYVDGEFDKADPDEAIGKIASHIRRIQPHVVITFDQLGLYGHPDHIAICRFTTAAVAASADQTYEDPERRPEHSVSKLYYMAWTQEDVEVYSAAFGDLVMNIDNEERRPSPIPEWAVTTRIECRDHWNTAWEAISHHRTQLPGYSQLLELPESVHLKLWGRHLYVRIFSRVPVRSQLETDLFEGLRDTRTTEPSNGASNGREGEEKNGNWIVNEIRRISHPVWN